MDIIYYYCKAIISTRIDKYHVSKITRNEVNVEEDVFASARVMTNHIIIILLVVVYFDQGKAAICNGTAVDKPC